MAIDAEKYPLLSMAQDRLIESSQRHFANDNIHPVFQYLDKVALPAPLASQALDEMKRAVEEKYGELLELLLIDWKNDHNSEGTPRRVAKMLVEETYKGRYLPTPKITAFPNDSKRTQMIVVGPLRVESQCSHHHQNIRGSAWIGVMPSEDGMLIGLSKFSRLLDHICRRPQIQEEMVAQVCHQLNDLVKGNLGVAVVINAEHQCMAVRGVQEPCAQTVTSEMLGAFLEPGVRQEFLTYVQMNPAPC
ncbi:GTP cyclohydrolase [Pseudomonas phage vB_PpuM-Peetri]